MLVDAKVNIPVKLSYTTRKHFSRVPMARLSDSTGYTVNKFEHVGGGAQVGHVRKLGPCTGTPPPREQTRLKT